MRIQFNKDDQPNPELVFPDPGSADSSTVLVLNLPHGVPFIPQTYIDLGYTNYEVWCVGGAGGTGGDAADGFIWRRSDSEPMHVPDDVWESMMQIHLYYASTPTSTSFIPYYGNYDPPYTEARYRAYQESLNPGHMMTKDIYHSVELAPDGDFVGGAGGGGGVHSVSGLLVVLPDEVPVVVGQAGAKGAIGQVVTNGMYTPHPEYVDIMEAIESGDLYHGRPDMIPHALASYEWRYVWDEPHEEFGNPQPGQDGEHSSFNETLCKASGGKGGSPAKTWVTSAFQFNGAGGNGGNGNRTTAGGGAAGSASSELKGAEGNWNPVTKIGEGGGGGRGGRYTPPSPMGGGFGLSPAVIVPATDGGRGAFSYVDTQVYGPRQQKSVHTYVHRTYDLSTGEPNPEYVLSSPGLTEPGGGGGARANHQVPYGGRGPGSDPNGVVLIRIFRID